MTMKEHVSFTDFCDRWRSHDRNESFSYKGKRALFDWLEEYEESTGEEMELDVIALDCEFAEYDDLAAFCKDYGKDFEGVDALRDETTVIDVEGGRIIVQGF